MKNYLGLIPKYFRLNKKRTIFSILGIILSITLLTAVSVLTKGASAGDKDRVLKERGFYHIYIHNLGKEARDRLAKLDTVEKLGHEQWTGTFQVEGQRLSLNGEVMDKSTLDLFNISVTEGRFPEKENEILLDQKAFLQMNPRPVIGDKLVLIDKKRVFSVVTGSNKAQEKTIKESNTVTKKELIISGIYKTDYYPFQYSAIMYPEYSEKTDGLVNRDKTYIKFKAGVLVRNEVRKLIDEGLIGADKYVEYNDVLLIALGQAVDWNNLMFQIIFSIVICLATIAAIYNIFYISVIERIRHYGVLRSVGSSPRQIRKMVVAEGLTLCLIALPIGLTLGILLARVIFILTPQIISSSAKFILILESLIAPAILGVATTILSTLKPAWVAGKISPIEAISNTGYRLEKQKFKVRRWQNFICKIFSISGLLAYRNLWRNKKKFLITVFSMCLSTILFIVFTYAFSTLFTIGENSYKVPMTFSISNGYGNSDKSGLTESDYDKILSINGIEKVGKVRFGTYFNISRSKELVTEDFKKKQGYLGDAYNIKCRAMGVDTDVLRRAKLKSGSINEVLKPGTNAVIIENNWPANKKKSGLVKQFEIGEELSLQMWDLKNNKVIDYKVRVAGILDDTDSYWRSSSDNNIRLIFNNTEYEKLFGIKDYQRFDLYTDKNIDKTKIFSELERTAETISDSRITYYEKEYSESIEQGKNIKAFYLGFIAILSLIGAFNIFNTISAGLFLRVREFSTLKAIGMSHGQLKANIRLEGIFHGIISSIWGSVFGVIIAYVFYRVISEDVGHISWQLPWTSILIAAGINIFICLVATSAPLKHISKLNIIEGIRVVD